MSEGTINPLLQQLNAAAPGSTTKKKEKGAIGQDEFLQMLVTQLKNQDPLDPMSNEDFAVNLAQFSQLERLVSIDQKLGKDSGSGGISSYAGYLGNEVTINSDKVDVSGGDAGQAVFSLLNASSSVQVELLDPSGAVAKSIDLGSQQSGKHRVDLTDLDIPNGQYTVRAVAQSASGESSPVKTYAAGVVTGFIPGAEPTLLIGDREIAPSDILQVNAPRQ